MRFADLLRVTVLLSAGAATALAVTCVLAASADGDATAITIVTGWWIVALLLGAWIGRRDATTTAIGRALAEARAASVLPEQRPTATLVNRLWPLLVALVLGAALAAVEPQVPGVASGFAMLWALGMRRQEGAVAAIEERDGVTFFVERTSPVQPVKLVRTPGLRREGPRTAAG